MSFIYQCGFDLKSINESKKAKKSDKVCTDNNYKVRAFSSQHCYKGLDDV